MLTGKDKKRNQQSVTKLLFNFRAQILTFMRSFITMDVNLNNPLHAFTEYFDI